MMTRKKRVELGLKLMARDSARAEAQMTAEVKNTILSALRYKLSVAEQVGTPDEVRKLRQAIRTISWTVLS